VDSASWSDLYVNVKAERKRILENVFGKMFLLSTGEQIATLYSARTRNGASKWASKRLNLVSKFARRMVPALRTGISVYNS
jgi:hypothetical protein